MSQTNSKWAKLYTQTDSQMLATITPSDNGFLVEKQMMVNGELHAIVCYDGGDENYAREVFDGITRDDVNSTMLEITSDEMEEVEEPVKEPGSVGPNPDGEHFQEEKFVDIAVTLENIEPKGDAITVRAEGEEDSMIWDGKSLFAGVESEEDIYESNKEKLFVVVSEKA